MPGFWRGVLKKGCVHISGQRVSYSGTSAREPSVNAPLDSKARSTTRTRFSHYYVVRARTNDILAGKRDRHPHSTTSFSENVVVAKTSYQINVRNFII